MKLLSILSTIPDHRDAQGREYRLEHILLFSILALLSNAKGYTDIERFITAHFEKLKSIFNLGGESLIFQLLEKLLSV